MEVEECFDRSNILANCEATTSQKVAFHNSTLEDLKMHLNGVKKICKATENDLSEIKLQLPELHKKLGKLKK